MVQDSQGRELAAGDRVLIEAEILRIHPGDNHTNLDIQLLGPPDQYRPKIICHSSLVTKQTTPENVAKVGDAAG